LVAIIVSVLMWANLSNPYVWCVLLVLAGYGAVGFVDDYRKVVRKDTKGLIARWKYFWQSVIALVVAFTMYSIGKDTPATQLVVPFFKDVMPQLGLLYVETSRPDLAFAQFNAEKTQFPESAAYMDFLMRNKEKKQ